MTRMESKHFVSLLFLVNFIFYYIIQAIPKVLFSVNIFNNFVYLCVEKYLANPLPFHSWFTSEIVNSSRKVKNLVRSQNKFLLLKDKGNLQLQNSIKFQRFCGGQGPFHSDPTIIIADLLNCKRSKNFRNCWQYISQERGKSAAQLNQIYESLEILQTVFNQPPLPARV